MALNHRSQDQKIFSNKVFGQFLNNENIGEHENN